MKLISKFLPTYNCSSLYVDVVPIEKMVDYAMQHWGDYIAYGIDGNFIYCYGDWMKFSKGPK